jgi:hypothetical protein
VRTQLGGGASALTDRAPIPFVFDLWFFVPDMEAAQKTGVTCIAVFVNRQIATPPGYRPVSDASGRELFLEPGLVYVTD